MREAWQIKVKKLALAYGTGWEYMPGSDEAGSVLMDIFLDMEEKNQIRYRRIWDKQESVFLQVAPESDKGSGKLRGALSVTVSEGNDGGVLRKGTQVHTVTEQGELVRFRTDAELRLTAAKLSCAIYAKGLCAWLAYDREQAGDDMTINIFQPVGEQMMRPVFRWYFPGVWDGHKDFSFVVEFLDKDYQPDTPFPGQWSVSDGQTSYPMAWQQKDGKYLLEGECPGFAGNLENIQYEVCAELAAEELTQAWADLLWGGFALREEAGEAAPEKCMVDSGGCGADRVLPFDNMLQEAACCYLSCDRAVVCGDDGITMQFTEHFEIQEKLPEPPSEEYEKIYKKYPWLRQRESVQDWAAEYTVWEYFNGRRWCILPGSADWGTGCPTQPDREGQDEEILKGINREYHWRRPADMQPCAVDGEEHFYLRLRLCSTAHPYAPYYRRYVPVLEDIRLGWEGRRVLPVGQELPARCSLQEEEMYFGFDNAISPGNCWYTGEKGIAFAAGEIEGEGERFGRKAYWVGMKNRTADKWDCLLPNYVEILQESEDVRNNGNAPDNGNVPDNGDDSGNGTAPGDGSVLCIPAGSPYAVDSAEAGVLDAISVSDARCVGGEAPLQDEKGAAEHYFAHYGRLVTVMDMEQLLQERYPFLTVEDCFVRQESGELEVGLLTSKDAWQEAQEKLPEIREWLETAVARLGTVWLQHSYVKCSLHIAGSE